MNYLNEDELNNIALKIFRVFTAIDMCDFIKAADLAKYHFGLGTWIRNELVTDDSLILSYFHKHGITHKDDISTSIIKELHDYLSENLI